MRIPRSLAVVLAVAGTDCVAIPQPGACAAGWTPGLVAGEVPAGLCAAMVVFDDGSGPAVYAGVDDASVTGPTPAAVVRWDGAGWEPVGDLPPGFRTIVALGVYDAGDGARLYALAAAIASQYHTILRWAGGSWQTIANLTGSATYGGAMAVFDSGSGPELVVAGGFLSADGNPANRVAAWNGTSWRTLGAGLGQPPAAGNTGEQVFALAVFDDGGGPALHAAGSFLTAGGAPAARIARWDGAAWSAVGAGMDAPVLALQPAFEGGIPVLIAGGWFASAGGAPAARIARWDGTAWTAVGGGMAGAWPVPAGCPLCVRTLAAFDAGSGPELVAGGGFQTAGGVPAANVARWDGTTWSPLGAGLVAAPATLSAAPSFTSGSVAALVPFDNGGGPALVAAGEFSLAGAMVAGGFAQWSGATWTGAGAVNVPARLSSFAVFDPGSGPSLFGIGQIVSPGGDVIGVVARWTGSGWLPVGFPTPFNAIAGIQDVGRLAVHDDGSGPALYAAGPFTAMNGIPMTGIGRWDGTTWSPVGPGIASGTVLALASFDDGGGPRLFAAGPSLASGPPATAFGPVLAWNGTAWSAVGTAPPGWSVVASLAAFDDGSGPALWAGSRGGNPPLGLSDPVLMRWDGGAWTVLAVNAIGSAVTECLEVFDSGTGPALHAGGIFAGPAGPLTGVARWNGAGWTPIGAATLGGSTGLVRALAAWDDGTGPALGAAGEFATIGGVPAARIGLFRPGAGWSAPGTGIDNTVWDLAVFDDGQGPALFAGGRFARAGGYSSRGFARYGPSAPRILVEPRSAAVLAGAPASLRVSAAGPGTLAWQWRRNGAPVPGAVAPVLDLPSAAPSDAGLYDVVVANGCGSTTSVAASLRVDSIHLRLAPDQGRGSARLRITSLHPGRTAFTLLSSDSRNWTNPYAGLFGGLHLGVPEALAQVLSAAPPFVQVLDGTGSAGLVLLPGAVPAGLLGVPVYGVTAAIDPLSGGLLGVSAIARITP